MTNDDLLTLLADLFGEQTWPKPLHQLLGLSLVRGGKSVEDAAATVGTSAQRLRDLAAASDPIAFVLGASIDEISDKSTARATRVLGQLLVGRAAETAFEDIYREEMHTEELELRDVRESRTDTDYRLYNGSGRAIYRLNIKFHGARFRRAKELVGLDPDDCFALATYKIHSALRKQDEEALPYLFAIVSLPLTAQAIGQRIPDNVTSAMALIYDAPRASGKRDFEDRLVEQMVSQREPAFAHAVAEIENATWHVLGARRADQLVKEHLYERVFATRIPRFAQVFRSAELDMHFSLSNELIPLRDFLGRIRSEGHPKVATMVERGMI